MASTLSPSDDTESTATGAGAAGALAGALELPERYEDRGQLGSGGFGEVRRVWDRKLKRAVAMKILRPDVAPSAARRARFLAEIELTAGLSHPGIVAVHDYGELEGGQLWFTMAEVRGRTLRAVIDEAFRAGGGHVPRRRLLDVFARVCETVAYAHSRGVIHRDLKPANVMVGAFAEVLVMDWGIARSAGEREDVAGPGAGAGRAAAPAGLTGAGDIIGTPAYMAPEQARGDVRRHGPATDTYALGAMLHDVLVGRPPPAASTRGASDDPPLLDGARGTSDVPPELAAICRRAMALEVEARYPDAGALARDVEAFLDGARRRERALAAFVGVRALGEARADLRARAAAARDEARRALAGVKPSDAIEAKAPGWEREDEAERLEREASLREAEWIQAVHGALAIDPELPEAHGALADHYRDQLLDAERARRLADAARAEVLLRAHDRGRHAAFLRGDGAVTLVTDPPGARVTVHRYVLRGRRLVEEPAGELGRTPLHAAALPHGSYLLRVSAPGRREVRYPVLVERGEHWDSTPSGASAPVPIALPREGDLGPDEVYVPAGYAWTGGDPEAADALPRRRIWVDGFVLRRFSVTNRELLEFLDDLARQGLDNAALGLPAAHPGVLAEALGMPGITRDAAGRFALRRDTLDPPLQERWPAIVDGHVAGAYARWLAIRTGKPWRLPDEIEREKAARGADGRLFPWGDHAEPAFACVLEIHRGEPTPWPVDEPPTDESPYGARGLGGTARDWCANVWRHGGPPVEGRRLRLEAADPEDDDFRAIRGGGWGSSIAYSRAAVRFGARPGIRRPLVGIRPARSFPAPG
ncbi:bifunctional serine/threonine-protein kinase/formylglycine-generating enzyme family protein [Sorangium sp. So ce281]|uniref:protein kinase domain-containing protein n=1 Tax=unclassified Sorangium TaxID=2621164 RepID=UPI003F624BB2